MKKLLSLLLALSLPLIAVADGLPIGRPLQGEVCYPEGCDAADAVYIYRYTYPTVEGDDEAAQMINAFYTYLVDDALGFAAPMAAEELMQGSIQAYTTITSEITCNNDRYVSVKVTNESMLGAAASHVVSSHVFARSGGKVGTPISLPHLLGILDADEADTWMQERQTAKADTLIRTLVWDVIQDQLANGQVAYYDDLTAETLENCFYPEEDFYLDDSGNPVFYLQEGTAAPVTEGVLLFPFTLEELLDEI